MIHWFKKHPEYLVKEAKALSSDANYKQLYIFRENLLVSHGNIIVRRDKIYRFPFLIVYTDATPYALPVFFPLRQELTEQRVKEISRLTQEQVFPVIKGDIQFYYHLRHQNSSGALCILEWDNLDDGIKFYGISTILKRVKDWCKGILTGEFPPDSEEVEFSAHFNNVDDHLHFFYPDNFLQTDLSEGEAYANLFTTVPKGVYFAKEHLNYIGCLLTGTDATGLYRMSEFEFPKVFTEVGIQTEVDLVEKKGSIKRLVTEGVLLEMYWFKIAIEPSPFRHFEELVTIIGEGEKDRGMARMIPLCLNEIKLKPKHFFVALRFPNRKGAEEFQLFRVAKTGDATGILLGLSEKEVFDNLITAYGEIHAVQSAKLTDENFHQRNSGRADRSQLVPKIVNVIGVGALGSEIADCIGKAGVGILRLFDNQTMKIQNSIRHLVGIDYVGVLKVIAVKNSIGMHNPFVNINAVPINITSTDVNDFLLEDSISISTIADDNTEAFLNEQAVISNKTIYYSRALRGGKIARIFCVIPGKDACFHCLHLYKNDGKVFIAIPEDPNLPTLKNECNNPIRPASAADLKLISSLTARIILDELLRGPGEVNHWIWSTEKVEFLQAYQLAEQSILPHPECCYCQQERKMNVFVEDKITEFMQKLVVTNPRMETGGVLAGFIEENGDIQIKHASGPGPNAVCTATKFEKDIEYCQSFLDKLSIASDGHTIYIGEWHSHPSRNNSPSNTDIKSLTEIAFQKEYLTDSPIMIIFSNSGEPSCTVHPAGRLYYFTELISIKK